MAPEVYNGNAYGESVDVYSLGLVLYKCLNNNRLPFFLQYLNPSGILTEKRRLIKEWQDTGYLNLRMSRTNSWKYFTKACEFNPQNE